eukprot:3611297-Prorocentrum_lima.AAC.1
MEFFDLTFEMWEGLSTYWIGREAFRSDPGVPSPIEMLQSVCEQVFPRYVQFRLEKATAEG